jgi:hypothetical protein
MKCKNGLSLGLSLVRILEKTTPPPTPPTAADKFQKITKQRVNFYRTIMKIKR